MKIPNMLKDAWILPFALYEFAKKYRGLGESGGFYGSSYDHDELAWAAVWLNIATGDMQYIDDIVATDSEGNYIG